MPNVRNFKPDKKRPINKLTFWLVLTTLILFSLLLLVTGCGKKGSLNPLSPPQVFITSYEGVEDTAEIADPYLFQKRVYWRGESQGGVVEGYAYRVLDLEGQPVRIPKTYSDEEGWLYHYKPGADQSIPLTNPDVRTIWTTKVFDVINFPAASADGDSSNVVSIFEIKCKDNYEQESEVVSRYFNVTSHLPEVDIMFADRHNPLTDTILKKVGLGFDVEFHIEEMTPYTTNDPNYFMFRIEKWNIATQTMISENPPNGEWFDTRNQANVSRMWLAMEDDDPADFPGRDDVWFVLSPDQFNPEIIVDPENTTVITETRMRIKAVNMANVQSPERTAKFAVYEHFRPEALVYNRRTNVLGSNHFTTFQDVSINRPLPEVQSPIPGEGTQYGTPFFFNKDGVLAALWSDDLKIYLSWGWKGQFANDDPDLGFTNRVHDVNLHIDYLATVKAFDLRLDGQPYHYPPLADNVYVDDDGTAWLRVLRYQEIDTRALLTSIGPGEHLFEVRVLDSQNRTSAPKSFEFNVTNRVPANQKNGILIIDDETYPVSGSLALDPATDAFYNYITASYTGPVEVLKRAVLKDTVWDPRLHNNRNVISPTDLESYRLIIWHADYPTDVGENSTTFHKDFDAINLYMRGSGSNILISAGRNLLNIHTEAKAQPFYNFILEKYFGIPYAGPNAILPMSDTFAGNPFMIGAYKDPGLSLNLPDLDLNTGFHPVVNVVGGLGPVAYFNLDLITDHNVIPFYRMNTVPAGENFQDKVVAIRRRTNLNTTYMFGFPLSYMDQEQTQDMMDVIITDLGL